MKITTILVALLGLFLLLLLGGALFTVRETDTVILTQFGAPVGWTLTISDVTLSAGAGFVVAIAGSMMLMPGLGKVPQAQKLDVDDQGRAIGMDY